MNPASANRSVPIHTDFRLGLHQTRSTIFLSPHFLPSEKSYYLQYYTLPVHGDHSLVDNRNDSHEHAPMRFPCFYALDHKCNGLFGVLHLRFPVRDGLCNIELSARLTDPRTAHTPGLGRDELSRC